MKLLYKNIIKYKPEAKLILFTVFRLVKTTLIIRMRELICKHPIPFLMKDGTGDKQH